MPTWPQRSSALLLLLSLAALPACHRPLAPPALATVQRALEPQVCLSRGAAEEAALCLRREAREADLDARLGAVTSERDEAQRALGTTAARLDECHRIAEVRERGGISALPAWAQWGLLGVAAVAGGGAVWVGVRQGVSH